MKKIIILMLTSIKKWLTLIKGWLLNLVDYINRDKNTFSDHAKELSAFVVIIASYYLIIKFILGFIGGLSSTYITIDQFEVPAYLANNGYTVKTIASRLKDEMEKINSGSAIVTDNIVINLNSVPIPSIIIPGSTISFESLIMDVRRTFRKPLFVITGDITKNNDKLKMMVRISGRGPAIIEDKDNNIDNLIKIAGETLYLNIDPIASAGNYLNNGEYNNAIDVCKSIQTRKNNAAKVYLIWATSLFYLRKYDEGLEKITLAENLGSNQTKVMYYVYSTSGSILRKLGKYDDAIKIRNKQLSLYPMFSSPYYAIADILILQGKYKESVNYLNKGIDLDKNKSDFKDTSEKILSVIADINNLSTTELDTKTNKMNEVIFKIYCNSSLP